MPATGGLSSRQTAPAQVSGMKLFLVETLPGNLKHNLTKIVNFEIGNFIGDFSRPKPRRPSQSGQFAVP